MKSLFEIKSSFTRSGEDYENKLVFFEDGSIKAFQCKTYCWEPENKKIKKEPKEALLNEITALFNLHQKEIEEIPFLEIKTDTIYVMKIGEKTFSFNSIDNSPFIKDLIQSVKKILDKYHLDNFNWEDFVSERWIKL